MAGVEDDIIEKDWMKIHRILGLMIEERATTDFSLLHAKPFDPRSISGDTACQVPLKEDIVELVAWACFRELDPLSKRTRDRIYQEAKRRFPVTNTTAKDYAQLAVQVLTDKSRTELKLRLWRERIRNR